MAANASPVVTEVEHMSPANGAFIDVLSPPCGAPLMTCGGFRVIVSRKRFFVTVQSLQICNAIRPSVVFGHGPRPGSAAEGNFKAHPGRYSAHVVIGQDWSAWA